MDSSSLSPSQQLSTNCCKVGHCGTGSVLQELLLCRSPVGSQVLPGPCSSVGCPLHGSVLPGTTRTQLSTGFPRAHSPSQAPPARAWAPAVAAGASLLPTSPPWLQGHSWLPMGFPRDPRAICAWSSSCPPPALPGVCRAVPLPWLHPALLWPQFQLCNNLEAFSSPLCYPQGVPTICAGLGLGQWWLCPGQLLELALPGTGGASGTCSQEPPLPLPWYPNPARPSQHPLTCRWLQRQLKRHGKAQVTTKHDTHIHSLLSLGRWGRESGKKGKSHGLR